MLLLVKFIGKNSDSPYGGSRCGRHMWAIKLSGLATSGERSQSQNQLDF